MKGSSMNTLKRVLGTLVASLFILSLALVAGATASSAVEPNNIDREALNELSQQMEELKKAGEFDGETSAEALIRDNAGAESGISAYAKPNGCSVPKGLKGYKPWNKLFKPACDNHDRCYSKGSKKDRKTCDNEFRTAMTKICIAKKKKGSARVNCFSKAAMYSTFVRTFGKGHYKGSGKNN